MAIPSAAFGLCPDAVDILKGRIVLQHEDYKGEKLTGYYAHLFVNLEKHTVREPDGTVSLDQQYKGEGTLAQKGLTDVPDCDILRDTNKWTPDQRRFFRAVGGIKAPCCRWIVPDGTLVCQKCSKVWVYYGRRYGPSSAAALDSAIQRPATQPPTTSLSSGDAAAADAAADKGRC